MGLPIYIEPASAASFIIKILFSLPSCIKGSRSHERPYNEIGIIALVLFVIFLHPGRVNVKCVRVDIGEHRNAFCAKITSKLEMTVSGEVITSSP